MQALLAVHVKHEYVSMGSMTDKKNCYMVMKALGFDWLKITQVLFLSKPDQNV